MLGAQAYTAILELWYAIVPRRPSALGVGEFITEAVEVTTEYREKAQRLAVAYTRLDRALRAGATYPSPYVENPPGVEKIDDLRREFYETVQEVAPGALETNVVPDKNPYDNEDDSIEVETPDGSKYRPYSLDEFSGQLYEERDDLLAQFDTELVADLEPDDVLSEEIGKLNEYLEELDRSQEEEAQALYEKYAAEDMERDFEEAAEREREDRIKEYMRVWNKYGNLVAGHGERITQNGGRHFNYMKGVLDKRVIGFARVHHPQDDTWPCGFCAMLISRQIFYKSEESAGGKKKYDENGYPLHNPYEYHNGCHCTAEEIYSRKEFESADRFQMNRDMWKLWREETGGSGKDSLSQFRRLMRERQKQADQESDHNHTPGG